MCLDLIAGTDAGLCAIFDPLVARLRLFRWSALLEGSLEKEVAAGRLVLLDTGSDGTFKFHAYVDEAPPPALLARAFHQERGKLLRVPSGTLRSVGAEFLSGDTNPPPAGMFTEVAVPPGDYSFDAYLVESNEDDAQELFLDKLTGAAIFFSLALGCLALLLLSTNDWEFQPVSLAIVVVLAAFWPLLIGWHWLPSTRAARRHLADAVTPSLVLVFTALPPGADLTTLKGSSLRPVGPSTKHASPE